MVDNVAITAGSGTNIATDDIASVHFQKVKINLGGDGVDSGSMASGAGVVGVTVPRVTLASDDPAVTALQIIDNFISGARGLVTEDNSAAIKTAAELIDNAISGAGFNITQFGGAAVPIGAGLEATAIRVTLPTDGTGVVKLGAGTAAIGKLAANSGVDIGDVDILTLPALVAGTANIGDIDILTIAAGDNNIGNVDIVTVPADPFGANADVSSPTGSISAKLKAIATAIEIMDDWDNTASDGVSVSGDVAHDGIDAGEPIKNGFKAVDIGITPTAVAANDRSNAYGLRNGVPLVLGGVPNLITKHFNQTDADGAQTDVALITAAAGTAIVVTGIDIIADNANTADVGVRIGFGTVNTPANDANAGVIASHPGIPKGGGITKGWNGGIVGMGASDEDLRMTSEDAVGGNLDVLIQYFTILIG